MSEIESHRLTRRCPVCFSREIDVLMIHEGSGNYYCVKCSFRGSESEIRAMYADIQKKYHWRSERVTMERQEAL